MRSRSGNGAVAFLFLLLGVMAVGASLDLSWYNTRSCDCPYPFRLWDQQDEFQRSGRGYLASHVLAIAWVLPAIALVLVALSAVVRRGAGFLTALVAMLGTGAPAFVIGLLTYEFHRHPRQGTVSEFPSPYSIMQAGFWFYAAGCLLLVAAALAVPRRQPRTESQA